MGVPLFGQEHVDRYRETDGEEGHDWQGTTVLLLTTTGRNSGAKQTTPLISNGTETASSWWPPSAVRSRSAVDVIASVRTAAEWAKRLGRGVVVVVGFPGVVDPRTGRVSAVANIDGFDGTVATRRLAEVFEMPVVVENDVNLAALGEQAAGAGASVDNFAYVKVGSGIGAGLVLHGRLYRGARGAAGEVGFLPVGPDPIQPELRDRGGALEVRLAAGALLELGRDRQRDGVCEPYRDVAAILDAARAGDPAALGVTRHAAREIAICIAGITSVVDVGLVLLGGGVGDHADVLLHDIRGDVSTLVPAAPTIQVASLGDHATFVGAVSLGREMAQRMLIKTAVSDASRDDAEAVAAEGIA